MPSPAGRAAVDIDSALFNLQRAMQQARPGKYPDPDVPIEKWQMAHEHLLAAQELLGHRCG